MKDVQGNEIIEGQTIVFHWEDGEDEASAGVGNASYSSGSYECDVAREGKKLVFIRKDNGKKRCWSDFNEGVVMVKNW